MKKTTLEVIIYHCPDEVKEIKDMLCPRDFQVDVYTMYIPYKYGELS